MEELTLEEVQKRRERKRVNDTVEVPTPNMDEAISGSVRVDFESMGRFSMPVSLSFKDYSTADINSIVMSSQENLIETLVPILNGMICGENAGSVNVANMTVEEFIETLIAIKGKFNTTKHKHPYMCSCQYDKPEDDQKLQDTEIDLTTLKYKNIEQVEEEMRKTLKEDLDACSEKELSSYFNMYASQCNIDINSVSKDYIVNNFKITEPFIIKPDNQEIALRFTRISDVVKAQKILDKKYNAEIKRIQNRVEHNVSGEDLKIKKQSEIEELQKEKAKKLITYIKAFTIVSINGKELSDAQKIEAIENRDIFPRRITKDIDTFLDQMKYGVFDTREFTCQFCGKLNTEDLQYNVAVTELLPLNGKDDRDSRHLTRLNIRFGA